MGDVITPVLAEGATSVYHLYVIRTNKRDELQHHLKTHEVGTLIHYPLPPHLQEAYQELGYQKGDFPLAETIADTCLSLPLFPGLTDGDVNQVCNTIKQFYHG